MITYVQHDADGNLVAIVEIHTTEGHDVEQPSPLVDAQLDAELDAQLDPDAPRPSAAARRAKRDQLRAARQADREQRVAAAIEAREAATRAQLAQATTPGLIVLPKGAATPTHDGHKVDLGTGKVRARTPAERKAYADAQAAQAKAAAGPPP